MPALNPYFVHACPKSLFRVHACPKSLPRCAAFMPALNPHSSTFTFPSASPSLFLPLPPFPLPCPKYPFRIPWNAPHKMGSLQEDPPKGNLSPKGSHLLLEPLAHPHPPQVSLFLPLTLGTRTHSPPFPR